MSGTIHAISFAYKFCQKRLQFGFCKHLTCLYVHKNDEDECIGLLRVKYESFND